MTAQGLKHPATTVYGEPRPDIAEVWDRCPWLPRAVPDQGDLRERVRATAWWAPYSLRYAAWAYDAWSAADEAARRTERQALPADVIAALDDATRAGLDHLAPDINEGLRRTDPPPPSYTDEVRRILAAAAREVGIPLATAGGVAAGGTLLLGVAALILWARR